MDWDYDIKQIFVGNNKKQEHKSEHIKDIAGSSVECSDNNYSYFLTNHNFEISVNTGVSQ
jgi:hypothetical protein